MAVVALLCSVLVSNFGFLVYPWPSPFKLHQALKKPSAYNRSNLGSVLVVTPGLHARMAWITTVDVCFSWAFYSLGH